MTARLGVAPPVAILDDAERLRAGEMRALQRERLAWTLRHAYGNVPHYRRAFDEAGIAPPDFRDLPDLAKFPLTTTSRRSRTFARPGQTPLTTGRVAGKGAASGRLSPLSPDCSRCASRAPSRFSPPATHRQAIADGVADDSRD